MPSPGFAGSPPQPCAARGRTHGPQGLPWVLRGEDRHSRAPAPRSEAQMTLRHRCPAWGSPSLLEDTPEPRALACPGVPAADGDGTRPPELHLQPAQQDSRGPRQWTSAEAVGVPRAVDTAAKAAAGPQASSPESEAGPGLRLVPAAHEAALVLAQSRAGARCEVCLREQGKGRVE